MKRNIGNTVVSLAGLIGMVAILVLPVVGYVKNIISLVQLDFEPSYKAEIFRVAGIVAPPVGVIMGFVTFEEEKKGEE
jgi:hypothetical protein